MDLIQCVKAAIGANMALLATFLFLPILIFSDNISVYQNFQDWMNTKDSRF
ncbi:MULTISPECIES: hypothetical protein [Bacillaceae]|uniref:hypothetical protein n=1 Tax=Bacillaceae TaxID=186817 RepID=UPI0012ED025E|nr:MULTISPECIES: hypothetical protein [Bacillaceae]